MTETFRQQLAAIQEQTASLAWLISEFRQRFALDESTFKRVSALEKAIDSFLSNASHAAVSEQQFAEYVTPEAPDDWPDDRLESPVNNQLIGVLDDILSASSDLVLVQDRLGRYTYLNLASTQFLGVERNNFLGKTFHDLELPYETVKLFNAQREAVIAHKKTVSGEVVLPTIYQDSRVYQYTFSPIHGANGNVEAVVFTAKDINDRKRALMALQASEEKYRFLFDAATDAILITDVSTGAILNANWSAARQLGYSRKELFQLTIDDIETPMADSCRFMINQRLEKDGTIVFEHVYRHKNQSKIPVEISAQIIEYEDRLAIQSFVRDITERKRAETQLHQSEEMLRQIAENIRELFWICDPIQSQYLYISPVCEQVWGYPNHCFYENNLFLLEVVHPDDRDCLEQAMQQEISGSGIDIEYRIIKPNGEVRWIHDRSFPVKNSAGHVYRLVGTAEDITERKHAETALRQSEARYRAIVEDQTELVCRWLPDGTFCFVNEAYCRFFDLQFGILGRHNFLNLPQYISCSRVRAELKKLTRSNPVFTLEQEERAANGERRWLQWTNRGIFGDRDQLVEIQSVGRDITDRKQAEAKSLRLKAELEQRVLDRTAELRQINDELVREIVERQQAENQLKLVLQAAKLGSWELEVKSGIITCSEQFKANVGCLPDTELSLLNFLELIHSGDQEPVRKAMQQGIQTRTDFETEYRCTWNDGSTHWIWMFGRPSYDNKGNLIKLTGICLDITDRKQTEQDLQASQLKLNDIFNHAIAAITYVRVYPDRHWNYEYRSKGCEVIFGYTTEELMSELLWASRVFPKDMQTVVIPAYEAIFSERQVSYEYRFFHKSGELRWIASTLTSRRDDDEDCWMVTIVSTDITERKHIEAALREREERYRAIVEDQAELVCRVLPDGTLTFVNGAYCRYFGRTQEELIGFNFLNLIPPAEWEGVRAYVASLNPDQPIGVCEHQAILASGELRWQQWSDHAFFDEFGNITEIQCVGRDITDRKRVELDLQESEARFRSLFEQAAVGITLVDETGRYLRVNQRFCDIVGYSEAELLTLMFQNITHPEDLERDIACLHQQWANQLSSFSMVKRYIRKDRQIQWVRLTVSTVRSSNGLAQYSTSVVQEINDFQGQHDSSYTI